MWPSMLRARRCALVCVPHRTNLAATLVRGFATAAAASGAPHKLSLLRNLGVIAHIDAGKTTTSERMLFLARRIRHVGSVDSGDTTLDFLAEERERGITIQAAAISFQWEGAGPHPLQATLGRPARLNLIDTPGHVDFTAEVEQSLRVLDGAVCVLDGVKGVQAQTLTVWRQAQRYAVPRIVFVNKLDREGASVQGVLQTMRDKLHTRPLLLSLPLYGESAASLGGSQPPLLGVIDLLRMEAWRWEEEESSSIEDAAYTVTPLSPSHPSYADALAARSELLESLSEADDALLTRMLEDDSDEGGHLSIGAAEIAAALRRVVVSQQGSSPLLAAPGSTAAPPLPQPYTLVTVGSAKAGRGVELLLNAVVEYLPSPLDKKYVELEPLATASAAGGKKGKQAASKGAAAAPAGPLRQSVGGDPSKEPLLALAFKVSHDLSRGALPMVFVRVYSGVLRRGDSVISVTPPSTARQGPAALQAHTASSTSSSSSSPSSAASSPSSSSSSLSSLPRERPQKLVEISADSLTNELSSIEAGGIGALVGLKHTRTGDTILSSTAATGGKHQHAVSGVLPGMRFPEPVYFCSIEAASLSAAAALDQSLACLQREDPSLHVSHDADTGQTLLRGMGELHLEIVRSRLERDFRLGEEHGGEGVQVGDMRISYREGLGGEAEVRSFRHASAEAEVSLSLRLVPLEAGEGNAVELLDDDAAASLPESVLNALEAGARDGLARGPLLGFQLADVRVELRAVSVQPPSASPSTVATAARACAARAVQSALRSAYDSGVAHLLEPLMSLEVSVSSASVGGVLSELTAKRRASVLDVTAREGGESVIQAEVPLAEMKAYASVLRSQTAGNGSFQMQFKQFAPVPPHIQTDILNTPP